VIGGLLTSRTGEGVIGVTFSVNGPFNSTRVTANPLSALAPGVLRRIFEGTSAERELDALEAARQARTGAAQGEGDQPGEAPAAEDDDAADGAADDAEPDNQPDDEPEDEAGEPAPPQGEEP
jgi:hypothetical protein